MIKMLIGLLTYKIKNKKLFQEDLSKYPEGQKKLYDSLAFLGDLRDTVWATMIMFISFF